jgi:hypothetical protein
MLGKTMWKGNKQHGLYFLKKLNFILKMPPKLSLQSCFALLSKTKALAFV